MLVLIIQAHTRLNHFNLCVSATATLNKVDQFAADFDQKVMSWRDEIVKRLLAGI